MLSFHHRSNYCVFTAHQSVSDVSVRAATPAHACCQPAAPCVASVTSARVPLRRLTSAASLLRHASRQRLHFVNGAVGSL